MGTKPWRSPEAEAALVGKPADIANFRKSAEAAMRHAKPQSENGFKIELATRCLTYALRMASDSLVSRGSEHADNTRNTRSFLRLVVTRLAWMGRAK